MNAAGLALTKSFESCRLVAYADPKTGGAPWTVGFGATGPGIGPGTCWTQEQSDRNLVERLVAKEAQMRAAVHVPLTDNQLAALVSILDNVGEGRQAHGGDSGRDGIIRLKTGQPSSLLRLLNSGDYIGAADQFLRWVSPGSNVERGLRRRREAERALFLTP